VQKALILVLVPVLLGLVAQIIFIGIVSDKLRLLNQLGNQQQVLLDLNRIGSAIARATILGVGGHGNTKDFQDAIADLNDLEKRFDSTSETGSETDYSQLNETLSQAKLIKESVLRHTTTRTEFKKERSIENRKRTKASRQSVLLALMEFSGLSKKIVEYDNSIRISQSEEDLVVRLELLIAIVLTATIACGVTYAFFHFFTDDILKPLKIISENSSRLDTGE